MIQNLLFENLLHFSLKHLYEFFVNLAVEGIYCLNIIAVVYQDYCSMYFLSFILQNQKKHPKQEYHASMEIDKS
jgi:hypothetical protein